MFYYSPENIAQATMHYLPGYFNEMIDIPLNLYESA